MVTFGRVSAWDIDGLTLFLDFFFFQTYQRKFEALSNLTPLWIVGIA